MEIIDIAVCDGLRKIFKQQWDKHYGATKGLWDDTPKSGNELYNMEKARRHAKSYLNAYQTGKRSDWDCSALVDAILYSNAIKKHLNPFVSNEVDELRNLRNDLIHIFGSEHQISDADFDNALKKVRKCFDSLNLSQEKVEKTLNENRSWKSEIVTGLIIVISALLLAMYAFETKSLFRVLPTGPVHLVANRSQTVNAIVDELHGLSSRNNRALTYLYISGNPGSGKSQLARFVGQLHAAKISNGWPFRRTTFVMTLNGRSSLDILESYLDFARRLNCDETIIARIKDSNDTTTKTKTENLRTEIAKVLKNECTSWLFIFECTWLLIVDNVEKLSEISSFLPQREDEDWQGGQVLVTTQDMPSVPPNSSLTVHISVSKGMDPTESCEFITELSGLAENQDLASKVTKELDYQPLALASAAFYVQRLRETGASPQFTWKDYLKKLDEGKRNLTEMKLSEANMPAYSLTMSTAVLLAVNLFAENDPVLKLAFTFLSYVSFEALSLQPIINYVLHVTKELDKEDVSLRILQCSLVLRSDGQKNVSISLHRIVHKSIKLYIEPAGTKERKKSREPLDVFEQLLGNKCDLADGEIALIPHLRAFYDRTRNFTSILIAMKPKHAREMHEHMLNLTSFYIRHGEFLLSRNYLFLAIRFASGGRDEDFPKIGDIYNNLGVVEIFFENTKQAKTYLTEALKHYLRQHKPSRESLSTCLLNLASLPCSNPEECDEMLKYASQALQIDDSLEAMGLYYTILGKQFSDEGNFIAAEAFYIQASKVFYEMSQHVRDKDPKLCAIVNQLGLLSANRAVLYSHSRDYKRSKHFLTLSVKMYELLKTPNHLALGYTYQNLGIEHFKLNELTEAEHCFRRALEIYSRQLEPSNQRVRNIYRLLAGVVEAQGGRSKEAAELGKQYELLKMRRDELQ